MLKNNPKLFLQDEKGRFRQSDKKSRKRKKKKKQKKKKCDPEPADTPHHPSDDMTIPSGEIDPDLADTPPPSPRWHDHSIWSNRHSTRSDAPSPRWCPNSPGWQPHACRKQPHFPTAAITPSISWQQSTKSHPCRKQPHSPWTAITSSPTFKSSPPIPPMPIHYQKTSMKDLERKDKQIKKSIASLEKQLNELMFEKAHIQSCLDYFQTDHDDFMQTVENYHSSSTPPSNSPSPPRDHSPRHCQFHLDLPFSKVWLLVSYHLYQQTVHGHGVTVPTIPTHCIIVLLVLVGQMKVIMTLLSLNPFPCFSTGHPPLHLVRDSLLHHLMEQENPGTLTSPKANVYVMTASMAVVADGKYTAVILLSHDLSDNHKLVRHPEISLSQDMNKNLQSWEYYYFISYFSTRCIHESPCNCKLWRNTMLKLTMFKIWRLWWKITNCN